MTPIPVESPIDSSVDSEGASVGGRPPKRFLEGFALTVAALFGAVIVLAVLLVGRSLLRNSLSSVDSAAPTRPSTTIVAQGDAGSDTGNDAQRQDGLAGSDEAPVEDDESAATPPTNEVEPAPCPSDIDPLICDAADFVQQARGRPFRTFPTVEILEDEAFDAELLSDFEEYQAELDVDGRVLAALGLLDPDVSLVEAFRDALEVGVVGFYDPETGRLVVRGVELDLYAQLILVHELTHAFDDQWFDLDRDDFVDDDEEYGFVAVVEGNASRIEDLWRSQLDVAARALLGEQELAALSPEDLRRYLALPPIMLNLLLSPYIDGAVYIERLVASEGEAAIDRAVAAPPTSSEEILHPGTDRASDPEVVIAAPPAGGDVVDQGRLGELLIRLWLGRVAGDGWGGDSYVMWAEDGKDCLTVDLAADSEADLADLRSAAQIWLSERPADRSVVDFGLGPESTLRVTACT